MLLNRPVNLCQKTAAILNAEGIDVYQQWVCDQCNHAQTVMEPNKFHVWGKCERCLSLITIHGCGYMVDMGGNRWTH